MELRREILNKGKNFDALPKKLFSTRWDRYNANQTLIEHPSTAVDRGLRGLALMRSKFLLYRNNPVFKGLRDNQ